MADLIAYVDGGSLGNPGPAGVGVVIEGWEQGRITIGKWIGQQDNNVAEYLALLEALQCAVALKASKLHVYSDSEVVVRQMIGHYRCRSTRLYSLNWLCRKLAHTLEFSISHIRRELNSEANRLASAAARTDQVNNFYDPVTLDLHFPVKSARHARTWARRDQDNHPDKRSTSQNASS